jgi:hypothetical protein
MPPLHHRFWITETDAIAAAIDQAAEYWPEDTRRQLLLRLIEAGHRALRDDDEQRVRERIAAIESTAGILSGCYGPGYLEKLREDWPQ